MKKLLALFFIVCLVFTIDFALANQTVNVVTGFGYLTDNNGHIVAKAEYPIGTVSIPSGWTYTEVSDQATLNAISIYQTPLTPAQSFSQFNFDEDSLASPMASDSNMYQYFYAIDRMIDFQNFQGIANWIVGFFGLGKINQTEVQEFDNVMEDQQINLVTYNSDINSIINVNY